MPVQFGADLVLGLELSQWQPAQAAAVPEEAVALAERRQQARAEKDWATADQMRDELAQLGYTVKDTPDGIEVTPL